MSEFKNKAESEKLDWISISDKIPNHNQRIRFKCDGLWEAEGIFQDNKFVYSTIKGACMGNPTHWMPFLEDKLKNCECVIDEDDLFMSNGKLWVYDQNYEVYTEYEMNYCPMCGQKVERVGC